MAVITDSSELTVEMEVMESLTIEQMVVVAEWLLSGIEWSEDEGHPFHDSKSLEGMAHRLRGLAQIKQFQAVLIAR